MTNLPTVSKPELLDAIANSTLDALREVVPTISKEEILKAIADGVNSVMPTADQICMAITDGVKEAFDREDLAETISRGVNDAMPYGDTILMAITDGVQEAMRERAKR